MPASPTVHQRYRRLPSLLLVVLMAWAWGPTTAVATEAGRRAAQGHGHGPTDRGQARESGHVARQRAGVVRSRLRLERTHNRREARQRADVLRSRLRAEDAQTRRGARQSARPGAPTAPRDHSEPPGGPPTRAADERSSDTSTARAASRASSRRLPDRTSRYNVGGVVPRVRNRAGGVDFALRRPRPVFDGGGRKLAIARGPVNLNAGAVRWMNLDGRGGPELYVFAQRTGAGVAGWVGRRSLVSPPPLRRDRRNPSPPSISRSPFVIDAARGRRRLSGLRFVNSHGVFAEGGGNKGEHYGGRNPGPLDYIYLLFAAPNVRYGGVAKDSVPHGSRFFAARGVDGRRIRETMTMYRGKDFRRPVRVTFLYGRAIGSRLYGWIARANVGLL